MSVISGAIDLRYKTAISAMTPLCKVRVSVFVCWQLVSICVRLCVQELASALKTQNKQLCILQVYCCSRVQFMC